MRAAPRVAALAMVKDEDDIVEAFVRHTLAHVDHLHIVDNGSEDGTLRILAALAEEGLPLSVLGFQSPHFEQATALNRLMRRLTAADDWDWFLPLDADEFIQTPPGTSLRQLLAQTPDDAPAALRWLNFVPRTEWRPGNGRELRDSFAASSAREPAFYKVAIPRRLARLGTITEGNHKLKIDGRDCPARALPALLQHLPVRSSAQILGKALVGSARLAIKPRRFPGEGAHWDRIAAFARDRHYALTLADLRRLALRYPDIADSDEAAEPGAAAPGFDGPPLPLRHSQPQGDNLLARLDGHLRLLTQMLRLAAPPEPGSYDAMPHPPERRADTAAAS